MKVMIIGSGDRHAAIMAAYKQFGEDVYIIPYEEEQNYQFASDVIPFKSFDITRIPQPFKPPLTRQERRKIARTTKIK